MKCPQCGTEMKYVSDVDDRHYWTECPICGSTALHTISYYTREVIRVDWTGRTVIDGNWFL